MTSSQSKTLTHTAQGVYSTPKQRSFLVLKFTALALGSIFVLMVARPVFASQALATEKNCMSCHAQERKLVGPSFKEINLRYASNPGAVETLTKKIRVGGVGVWGPVPMPANAQVSEAEAKKLAEWILGK